jgi:hypothetical protein
MELLRKGSSVLFICFVFSLIFSSLSYWIGNPSLGNQIVITGFLLAVAGIVILTICRVWEKQDSEGFHTCSPWHEPLTLHIGKYKFVFSGKVRVALSSLPIFLVGFIVFRWFAGPNIITDADFTWWVNMPQQLWQSFFAWDSINTGVGFPKRVVGDGIPTFAVGSFTEWLGFPTVASFQLWFYLMYVAAGLSMFLFVLEIAHEHRIQSAILAALIYMFNPYICVNYIIFIQYAWFTFFPLKMLLYVKGLKEEKGLRYAFLFNIVIFLTTTPVPQLLPLDLMAFATYFLFYNITSHGSHVLRKSIVFSLKCLVIFVILNAYFILPMSLQIPYQLELRAHGESDISDLTMLDIWEMNSASPFSAAIRLQGFFGILGVAYGGTPYYPWGAMLNSPLFISLGYLLPLAFILGIKAKPRNREYLFLANLTVLGLILMNGSKTPFAPINSAIWKTIPMLPTLLHLLYLHFGRFVLFGYASLGGIGLASFYYKLRCFNVGNALSLHSVFLACTRALNKAAPGLFLCVLILMIGIYPYPIWTGEIIRPSTPIIGNGRYSLPSYYYEAAALLRARDIRDQNSRVLAFPINRIGTTSYIWSGSVWTGCDPTCALLRKLVAPTGTSVLSVIDTAFDRVYISDPANLLSLLNVRYIAVHHDINPLYISVQRSTFYYPNPMSVASFGSGSIRISNQTNFQMLGDELTVSSWILVKESGEHHIISKWESSHVAGSFLFFAGSFFGFAVKTENGFAEIKAETIIDSNFWYNLIGIYDGRTIKLYVNGELAGIENLSGAISANDLPLTFGERSTGGLPFTGYLSNIQIYGRALNQTEIETIYLNGLPGDPLPYPELLGWWLLNGDARDCSGNQNDGIVVGELKFEPYNVGAMPEGIPYPSIEQVILSPSIKEYAKFGNITLYENRNWKDLKVYASKNLFMSNTLLDMALTVENVTDPSQYVFYVGSSNNISFPIVSNTTDNIDMTYSETNPTEYIINVNSTSPFYLVLSQSFDSWWIATVDGNVLPNEYHFKANGYANGWYIPYAGTVTIRVTYVIQSFVWLGALMGVALVLFMLIYMWVTRTKKIVIRMCKTWLKRIRADNIQKSYVANKKGIQKPVH